MTAVLWIWVHLELVNPSPGTIAWWQVGKMCCVCLLDGFWNFSLSQQFKLRSHKFYFYIYQMLTCTHRGTQWHTMCTLNTDSLFFFFILKRNRRREDMPYCHRYGTAPVFNSPTSFSYLIVHKSPAVPSAISWKKRVAVTPPPPPGPPHSVHKF